jgi:thymidylate synthase (FAD)
MKVQLTGRMVFLPPEDVPWEPDELNDLELPVDRGAYDASAQAEFAGRACYQSWQRPNPKTATNEGYLRNIISVGHFSVLEHSAVTFYITGVSRSFTHELVRHRHLSYSQLSQRYVDESDTAFVIPPLVEAADHLAYQAFTDSTEESLSRYNQLVEVLEEQFPDKPRKEIRQAARAVLPNATETKIVVTGNYRAWWEVIQLRATIHADVEIRAVFIEILRLLQVEAPHIFNHFVIRQLKDGSEIAYLQQDMVISG